MAEFQITNTSPFTIADNTSSVTASLTLRNGDQTVSLSASKFLSGEGFPLIDNFEPAGRWDMWPQENIMKGSIFRPGFVAYSPNGIKSVTFECNGQQWVETEMKFNPDSGQMEYFPEIDTSSFEVGDYFVTAILEDNSGTIFTYDQTSNPLEGGQNPLSSGPDRPGEVNIPFNVIDEEPFIYYIAPFDGNNDQGAGTEDNPYRAVGTETALEKIIEQERPCNGCFLPVPRSITIRMLPGEYNDNDLDIDSWSYTAPRVRVMWTFENPSSETTDVVINRALALNAQPYMFKFKNIHIDGSDLIGNYVPQDDPDWPKQESPSTPLMTVNSSSVIIFEDCLFTAFKPERVFLGNDPDDPTHYADNWPRLVVVTQVVSGGSVYYNNCHFKSWGRPNIGGWSRNCRIEHACHDVAFGCLHLSLTVVDVAAANIPWSYWNDIHCDVWQDFSDSATGIKNNIIMRDYKLVRFFGQGPFFSGNTPTFKRIALVDCDFGYTNQEEGDTAIEDGIPFFPNPLLSLANKDNPGQNGSGYSVTQYDGYAQFTDPITPNSPPLNWGDAGLGGPYDTDFNRFQANEQRFFMAPGTGNEGGVSNTGAIIQPSISRPGFVEDLYVKNCIIIGQSIFILRGWSNSFTPTAVTGTRCVFEDTFTPDGVLMIPGTDFEASFSDRGSFKLLRPLTTLAGSRFEGVPISIPNLDNDFSYWEATLTPDPSYVRVINGQSFTISVPSKYTTGSIYRVTTGLSEEQYP